MLSHLAQILFGLPAYALVALAAGCASPRGFWLWGAAVVAHRPFADLALFPSDVARGALGPPDLSGFAFASVSTSVTLAVLCTLAAAAGAGLGAPLRRRASPGPS